MRRAVVKLNEGFSGDGNAIFEYKGAPQSPGLKSWIAERLPKMKFVAAGMTWDDFDTKLDEMGGIVEEFMEGRIKRSRRSTASIQPVTSMWYRLMIR